jgi:nucleoid DNA-binding protein
MENVLTKNKNINKKEFILKLAKKCQLSVKQVEIGVDGILGFLSQAFKTDCTIELRGFGKFICKAGKVRFKSFLTFNDYENSK